jgi:REP-associated tyrosine transposase
MDNQRILLKRKDIRIKGYDYSQPGHYFVTICSKDKVKIFGEIVDCQIKLNESGEIVRDFFDEIALKYSHCKILDKIIMPNHVHFILIIGEYTKDGLAPKLGNIIAFYKFQTSKMINIYRNKAGESIWQRNYHERIIRNDNELFEIRNYMKNNPIKWDIDEYYS